jgi:hypothetical protein
MSKLATTPIAAVVTEASKKINNTTGEDTVLHEVYTENGEFHNVWTEGSNIRHNVDEEVYIALKTETFEKAGQMQTRETYRFVSTKFAEKLLGSNEKPARKSSK